MSGPPSRADDLDRAVVAAEAAGEPSSTERTLTALDAALADLREMAENFRELMDAVDQVAGDDDDLRMELLDAPPEETIDMIVALRSQPLPKALPAACAGRRTRPRARQRRTAARRAGGLRSGADPPDDDDPEPGRQHPPRAARLILSAEVPA